MSVGSFIFVLHSHVPYVRKSGKWPHGEEMLFEIMAETYIPLLNSFETLLSKGIKPRVSLGLTPILLEQISDPYMQREFIKYLKIRIKSAHTDYAVYKKSSPEAIMVIEYYINWYSKILSDYTNKFGRDLVNAFKYYQDNSGLDILTSAATHGYLPLISKDSAIWGQLRTGIDHYQKYFNRYPTGIWLPECGYRPLTLEKRDGIEKFLESSNLKYFFTDTHVIEASRKPNGDSLPVFIAQTQFNYNSLQKVSTNRPKVANINTEDGKKYSTFHPYTVHDSNVYVFGRDSLTGLQVWSADWGYPGNPIYREFHKKAPSSGIQYWKISNKLPGLKHKEFYNPDSALELAAGHADHFTDLVTDHLDKYQIANNRQGVVVSSYDTELFGHWWFEGVYWLEQVIEKFHQKNKVKLLSARDYITENPDTHAVRLPESSWGDGGQHSTWLNSQTEEIWKKIHICEAKFEKLVQKNPQAVGDKKKLLNQAARELLLLQSSDWTFLITTVQATDYATSRFEEHFYHFNCLSDALENNKPIDKNLKTIFDKDNAFKYINYKNFKPTPTK
ncbi:MAG: DUF1957 domain-containing protein [bacterium]|nr:DUF1957 domain-containing protein [bacterium]